MRAGNLRKVVNVLAGALAWAGMTCPAWAGPAASQPAASGPAATRPGQPPASRPVLRGPLRVLASNPRYFTDDSSKAIYLTGSHHWFSLQDRAGGATPKPFDFEGYLDFLQQRNHNFIRLWRLEATETQDGRRAPHPWLRAGPGDAADGLPKFDLTRFDQAYFDRLRTRVKAAGERGIYVSIMLFEGWGVQFDPSVWPHHPFHSANNINGIDGDAGGDGKGFGFHTLKNPAVTALQEAYVRHVIDTVNDLDNVLYEIRNEDGAGSVEWQYYFIRLIHEYEAQKGRQHPVGMTFRHKGGHNAELFNSPADWVSPNPEGGYQTDPPPAEGRKVVLNDTDHLWGEGGDRQWVWKSFLRGHHTLFMDPLNDKPAFQDAPLAMGHTLAYARRVNLACMTPQPGLASSKYCLANPAGSPPEYLAYLTQGGQVTLDLSGTQGELVVEWFNPADGRPRTAPPVAGGASSTVLKVPFSGDAVLYLRGR